MSAVYHEPVLLEEALASWVTDPAGRYLDGTVGGGGHTAALLDRFEHASVLALDRDPDALEAAASRLRPYGERVCLKYADFGDLETAAAEEPGPPILGILLDLGVSSHQLDDPARGFSYLADAPLRLVLDRDAEYGAAEYLAEATEDSLRQVFGELGELPRPGRLARAVTRARDEAPIDTTTRLVDVLRSAGAGSPRRLSQAFQALRLHVNDELGSLRRGLDGAARMLPESGTLTVISFESLMDRMVKHTFRPPRTGRPIAGVPDPEPLWHPLTRAVRPTPEEIARNVRSRSARLRAARRSSRAC